MCININSGINQDGIGNEANQGSKNLSIEVNEVKKIARKSSMFWGFVSGVIASLIANCVFEWLK